MNVPRAESPGVLIGANPLPRLLPNVSAIYAPPGGNDLREIHIRHFVDGRLITGEGALESLAEDDRQPHVDDVLSRVSRYLESLAGEKSVPMPAGWRPMPQGGQAVMGFGT